MKNKNSIQIYKPFGPSIAKIKMSNDLIQTLNQYIDQIIIDKKKSKEQDHGQNLAGNVTQEFILERSFITNSGFGNFLANGVAGWLKYSINQEIKNFQIISSWAVRQFKNEYNPTHWHGGHVSGVGYLKLPKSFGKNIQTDANKTNNNGQLELIHGSKQFMSDSIFKIIPEVGNFYFFPHYLMHNVYPFTETEDERRSISFNAHIDNQIFNVYSKK